MTRHIPEIHAVGLTTPKALGEAAEAAFLAKATSLGFGVAKTWGDSERYDFILDSGQRRWRVQVKSSRYFEVPATSWLKGVTRHIPPSEIDFIVAYIVPENLWYVIPISVAALRRPDVRLSRSAPVTSGTKSTARPGARWLAPATKSLPPGSWSNASEIIPSTSVRCATRNAHCTQPAWN